MDTESFGKFAEKEPRKKVQAGHLCSSHSRKKVRLFPSAWHCSPQNTHPEPESVPGNPGRKNAAPYPRPTAWRTRQPLVPSPYRISLTSVSLRAHLSSGFTPSGRNHPAAVKREQRARGACSRADGLNREQQGRGARSPGRGARARTTFTRSPRATLRSVSEFRVRIRFSAGREWTWSACARDWGAAWAAGAGAEGRAGPTLQLPALWTREAREPGCGLARRAAAFVTVILRLQVPIIDTGDLQGHTCELHQGRVETAGHCSADHVQRCDAGKLQKPGVFRASASQTRCDPAVGEGGGAVAGGERNSPRDPIRFGNFS
ncbi:uncharacterized protein LOC102406896 [Bubalus bubalis]|uniref:uncharacterized protein LOC102406896 n=1 Tax=Bubalus bubalis TaxID=89462 RepID=UPI001E1B9A47|nr:uncharacterized protein LOC102406896 [Bubalus bubalis]